MGDFPAHWEYFGVKLPLSCCLHVYKAHRTHPSIIDDYQCRWPLIKGATTEQDEDTMDQAGVITIPTCRKRTRLGETCGQRCWRLQSSKGTAAITLAASDNSCLRHDDGHYNAALKALDPQQANGLRFKADFERWLSLRRGSKPAQPQ